MDFSNLKLDDLLTAIAAVLLSLPGILAYWQNRKKNAVETAKTDAETENVHADVADKWAKQVGDLLKRVEGLEVKVRTLELDNADLRDWAERLRRQVRILNPSAEPEPFISSRKVM